MLRVMVSMGVVAMVGSGCMGAEVLLQTGQVASLGCVVAMLWATLRLRGES